MCFNLSRISPFLRGHCFCILALKEIIYLKRLSGSHQLCVQKSKRQRTENSVKKQKQISREKHFKASDVKTSKQIYLGKTHIVTSLKS